MLLEDSHMATTDAAPEAVKKIRQRSPNYPTVGLEEALERVGKLFKEDGRAGAPTEIAAKHIGYSAAHGQAYSVLSALKKFGLLDEGKGRVFPSQRAIELLNLPANDPRRLQALKDAALSPPIYKELVEQHAKTGLPGNEALEAELVTYKSFNPKAVAGFVRDFRATLEFAGLSDLSVLDSMAKVADGGAKRVKIGDYVQWETNGILRFPKATKVTGFSDDGQFVMVEGQNGAAPINEIIPAEPPADQSHMVPLSSLLRATQGPQGVTMRQDVFSLPEGAAVINWPTPLSEDSISDLQEWLEILKRKISRSKAAPSESTETSQS